METRQTNYRTDFHSNTAGGIRGTFASSAEQFCTDFLRQLLTHVIWPTRQNICRPDIADLIARRSEDILSPEDDQTAGRFYSQKMQREVHYQSRSAFRFLRKLEYSTEVNSYVERPFPITYSKNDQDLEFVPGVLVSLKDGRNVIIEVVSDCADNTDHYAALHNFCDQAGWGMLITDGKNCFSDFIRSNSETNLCRVDFVNLIMREDINAGLAPLGLVRRKARRLYRIG